MRGVDPVDDAGVGLEPVGVVGARHGVGGDVVMKTKLGEDSVEEATPLAVVGVFKIQDDRDVRLDIHHLDGSRVDVGGGRCTRWRRSPMASWEEEEESASEAIAEWSASAIIAAEGGDQGAKGFVPSDTMKEIDSQHNNDCIHLMRHT